LVSNLSYDYYAWAFKPQFYLVDPANLNNKAGDIPGLLPLLRPEFLQILVMNPDSVANRVGRAWTKNDYSVFEEDFSVGNETVYRLREGIERFFVTDINNPAASSQAQSEIAVMHDDCNANIGLGGGSFNHVPGGGNVLYMDGHVVFIRYPGDWPICATWSNLMSLFGQL
jgi:prepilin-type processing-associated H-X9-DG protein